jgi:Fungalysin/Thermolysin Propeptide Motif.
MFKKFKIALLATTMVLPSVVYASALTAETPVAISAPVTAVPISATVDSISDDALLEAAINAAKKFLGNTDRFSSLSHSISDFNGVKVVYLYWYDSTTEGETLSATVGADGTLYQFSICGDSKNILPVITKTDALQTAYVYATKVDSEYASWISKEFATVSYSRWNGYTVTFQSIYNGYLVEGNSITVSVSPEGKVTAFNALDMARNVSIPEKPSTLISVTEAKNTLKSSLPLELVYKSFYSWDNDSREYKATIKLVYKLADNYSTQAVDAVTGKLIELQSNNYYYGGPTESADSTAGNGSISAESKLSEAERKEVVLQAGLLSAANIDAKLRTVIAFGFTSDLTLSSSTLYGVKSPYDGTTSYQWQLNYKDTDGNVTVYAIVDAKNGTVISFNNYNGSEYKPVSEFKYTSKECQTAAEKLLTALYGEKFSSYVYVDSLYSGVQPLTAEDQISSYSFYYVRTVNGVKFMTDTISVTVNPDTLEVFDLNFGYTDTVFPSVTGAINASTAADKYFAVVALNPYYIVSLGISDGKLLAPDLVYSAEEKQLSPVYSYIYNGYVDAISGELLDSSGDAADYKPTEYYKSNVSFVDIGTSEYSGSILALLNMDIITLDNVNYEPNRAITAAELETLLENAGYWYSDSDDKETASSVSVEDALYRVVCALGYSEIAKIDAIFKYPYSDASKVSKERVGAVAIGAALGLLDKIAKDGTLDPSAAITKGEAAQLVYNLIAHDFTETTPIAVG